MESNHHPHNKPHISIWDHISSAGTKTAKCPHYTLTYLPKQNLLLPFYSHFLSGNSFSNMPYSFPPPAWAFTSPSLNAIFCLPLLPVFPTFLPGRASSHLHIAPSPGSNQALASHNKAVHLYICTSQLTKRFHITVPFWSSQQSDEIMKQWLLSTFYHQGT